MFFFEQYFKYRNRVKATFTRASAAYKQDGSAVASGIPRIENSATARGIMVEEGTTNLLRAGADTAAGYAAIGGASKSDAVIDGYACIAVTTSISAVSGIDSTATAIRNNTNWNSLKIKGPVGAVVIQQVSGGIYPITLTGGWDEVSRSVSCSENAVYAFFTGYSVSPQQAITFYIREPMVATKTYKTSYTPPGTTRAAESLAIPVNAYHQKNLLTPNQATGGDTLGDTTGFGAFNAGASISRDITESWNGTGSIKVVTDGNTSGQGVTVSAVTCVVGKIYTATVYVWGNGAIKMGATSGSYSSVLSLSSTKQRLSVTFAAVVAGQTLYIQVDGTQAATFYIDGLQLEESTTASDWALPEVDYSNAVLNPTQGTVEMDVVIPSTIPTGGRYLLFCGDTNNRLVFLYDHSLSKIAFAYRSGSATSVLTPYVSCSKGAKTRVSARWGVDGMKVAANGVLSANTAFVAPLSLAATVDIGNTLFTSGLESNAYFASLRISRIARSDTEMAYTGTLKPDRHTTYYRDFTKGV